MLRVTASLVYRIPVSLRDALVGIDSRNLDQLITIMQNAVMGGI